MQLRTKTAALFGLAITMAAGLVAPALAGAANYPLGKEARSFHQGAGGWQGSTSSGGLCIPAVNCPTVTNEHAANGGADGQGDGYLRTRIGSLLGVGATSRGIYRSPSFRYQGAGGRAPAELTLSLKRRSTLGTLLAVSGNSAEYSVDLVDVSQGGNATSVIDAEPIGDQSSWRQSDVSVAPAGLALGDRYRVRITSEFVTGVQVVPGGSVGYDDVILRAVRAPRGGNGGNGDGGNVRRIKRRLRAGISPVVKRGRHLSVRVKCPRSVRPNKCRLKVAALAKRNGPRVTNSRKARIGAGKKRHLRLRVKRAHNKKVAHRRRILVAEKVKIGDRTIKVVKSVKVVRH
jgi:hypothetical protein